MRKHKGLLLGAIAVSMTAVCAEEQGDAIVKDAERCILQRDLAIVWRTTVQL